VNCVDSLEKNLLKNWRVESCVFVQLSTQLLTFKKIVEWKVATLVIVHEFEHGALLLYVCSLAKIKRIVWS
jgi:hypothetical protein